MSLEAASISDERRSSLPEAALLLDGLERDLGAEILSAASRHLLAVDVGPERRLVFVADDQMGYVAVNARACELLGYEREESMRPTSEPGRRQSRRSVCGCFLPIVMRPRGYW